MVKKGKIEIESCNDCGKELKSDQDAYYGCDKCGASVCKECASHSNEKDYCKACSEKPQSAKKEFKLTKGQLQAGAVIAVLLVVTIVLWRIPTPSITGLAVLVNNFEDNPAGEIDVDLFVMSQCPYGTQAEDLFMGIIEKFSGSIDFKLYFIASEGAPGTFSSLHGQPEVDENIRQLCVIKHYPVEFFDYLKCANKNIANIGNAWEGCVEEAGANVNIISNCASGEEGAELFSENIKEADKRGVRGSPGIYIAGESYSGSRDENALTRTICGYIPEHEVCANIEPEKSVNLFIVNDEDCTACDASGMIGQIKGLISKLNITTYDYESEEGKKLLDAFNSQSIPTYVFDTSLEEHPASSTLIRYTTKTRGYYLLKTPGSKFISREEAPKRVDLFVMSQCPYGTMAEAAMQKVVEVLPDIEYNIHFIATEDTPGTFSSLHGQPEVDENIRQLCVMEKSPEKLQAYLTCLNANYQNAGSVWEKCAQDAGISTAQVESCVSAEGTGLLSENIKLTNELGIGSSPTFLINNQIQTGGIDAEPIKQAICEANPGLDGCDTVIAGGSAPSAPAGSCG